MIGIEEVDRGSSKWILDHHNEAAQSFFNVVTQLGTRPVLALTTLAALLLLVYLRRYRSALVLLVVSLVTPVISSGAKSLVERDRPAMATQLGVTGYSYPSGHCLGVAATYGTLVLMLARTGERRRRWLYLSAAATVIFLVGASRVYLGVHYPSDVVGGWAAGLALALCGLWVEARIQAVPLAARLTVVKEEVPPPELLSFPEVEERVA